MSASDEVAEINARLMIAHSHLAHIGDQTQHDLASARTTARRQT